MKFNKKICMVLVLLVITVASTFAMGRLDAVVPSSMKEGNGNWDTVILRMLVFTDDGTHNGYFEVHNPGECLARVVLESSKFVETGSELWVNVRDEISGELVTFSYDKKDSTATYSLTYSSGKKIAYRWKEGQDATLKI